MAASQAHQIVAIVDLPHGVERQHGHRKDDRESARRITARDGMAIQTRMKASVGRK